MEAHTDRHPPVDCQHALDDFVYSGLETLKVIKTLGSGGKMDELKWDFLTEVQGSWQADLLKSYFEANDIEVILFQEALGKYIYPSTLDILGNVQIYVPKAQLTEAQELLKEYFNSSPAEDNEDAEPTDI